MSGRVGACRGVSRGRVWACRGGTGLIFGTGLVPSTGFTMMPLSPCWNELLYIVDANRNLALEGALEQNLMLCEEPPLALHAGLQHRPGDLGHAPPTRESALHALESEEASAPIEIDDEEPQIDEKENFPGSHPLSLEALVKRAHDGLGHPGKDRFLRILSNSKASKRVMDTAKNLTCSTCEKFKKPKPSRAGAPPRDIGLNNLVGINTFQVRVPFSQKTKYCLNIIDYSSYFQLVVPLSGHTPHKARLGYRLWLKIFGPPRKLYCDFGKEFQKELAEADGTELLPSALETPE